jgi:type I restriction enzyme S subunit
MRAMKDSGIEWIGEIPEEWEIRKIFGLLKTIGSGTTPKGKEEYYDGNIPWLNTGDLNDTYIKKVNKSVTQLALDECSALRLYHSGVIIIAMYGATIGKLGISTFDLTTNQACCVLSCYEILDKYFLFYVLHSCRDYLLYLSYGSGQPNISQNTIRQLKIALPTSKVQQQIVSFLDSKCAKIDEYVSRQQQVIEKLKAYKQSVITEAVTKGLDPDVPMKDSGVEWIGKIPENWCIEKLKYIATVMRGKFNHRPRNDQDYYDGIYPFVQTGDVTNVGKYITNYTQTLNELGYSVSKEFPRGSIVMTIAANIGDVAILDFKACFPDSIIGFVPKNCIQQEFLYFVLKSMKEELLSKATISTQMNINIEIVKEEFIPLAPIKAQHCIVSYLDTKCAAIDAAITRKQELIDKMTEYKKSLIYEAVTGKMEV